MTKRVPIDIEAEALIAFKEARSKLPAAPGRGTMMKYRRKGMIERHGRKPKMIKLETVFIAGRIYTSMEAWKRFWAAINGDG